MPTNIKCVFLFRDSSGTGWTEVHYANSAESNPNLSPFLSYCVDEIGPKRAQLLSADTFLIGARVSYPVPNGSASLSKSFSYQGNVAESGVSPSASLAMKFTDPSNTRRKVTHLRGFWDSVEVNGEYHPEAAAPAGWQAKLDAWKSSLVGGLLGWLSRSITNSTTGNVTGYDVGEDGRVTFALAGIQGRPLVVGEIGEFRFSRLNNSHSPLNTLILCEVIGPGLVKTLAPFAAGPFSGQGRFNLRKTEFYRYANLYDTKLGRRQQGKPLGQLAGRGPKILRY